MYLEDPFYFQDVDSSAQQQFGHCGGEFPYFQGGDLLAQEQSGPYEAESPYLNSLINYSLLDASGNVSVSPNPSPDRNLLAHPIDIPRASTPLQSPSAATHLSTLATEFDMGSQSLVNIWQDGGMSNSRKTWTAHDRDASTVDPKDLLRAPVEY
jgi:hypothetical protein